MKKIIIIAVALLLLGGAGFLVVRARGSSSEQAVLKVNATPAATIFLNDQNIGKTPYEEKYVPGEYTIKLIPEGTTGQIVSWEGKIKLSPNLLTYVHRELGSSELTSAGEILQLEKISGDKAHIAVFSTPDGASITLSGEGIGTTPAVIEEKAAGSYDLDVSLEGHLSRTLKIKTTPGYKLSAQFNLAISGELQASPSPEATAKASPKVSPKATPKASTTASPSASRKPQGSPPSKPYIEVLDTPTGFLNVRSEPNTESDIITKINPGEFYPLLDEQSGWYKIDIGDKEGWVSGQYAEKFE